MISHHQLLVLMLLLSAACATEQPEFFHHPTGGISLITPTTNATEPTGSVTAALAGEGTPTNPWEPGSGFFERDLDDPETQEYFSTCGGAPVGANFDTVTEIVADGATGTRSRYTVIRSLPDSPTFLDSDGLPITVGKRLNTPWNTTFAFESSYVDCNREPDVTDLSSWGYDAQITSTSECNEYWDYGQDRFRVWYHDTISCAGEDCSLPWLPQACESAGMAAFRRIPSPFGD